MFDSLSLLGILILSSVLLVSTSFVHPYHYQDRLSEAKVGKFRIQWDQTEPYLLIHHSENPNHILFQTSPSWPFITIGYATDSKPPIVDGNFKVDEWTLFETPYQSIKKVLIHENEIVISGDLWGMVTLAHYSLRFYIPSTNIECAEKYPRSKEAQDCQLLDNQLAFNLTVDVQQGTVNRVFLNYNCDAKEKFFGFGVQVCNGFDNNLLDRNI